MVFFDFLSSARVVKKLALKSYLFTIIKAFRSRHRGVERDAKSRPSGPARVGELENIGEGGEGCADMG